IMASRADLHAAIAAAIAGGRIGTPVFIRYLLHTSNTNERIEQLRAIVNDWMKHALEPCLEIRTQNTSDKSECLQSDRSLALVSITPNADHIEAADITVLGTHGAIYFPAEFPPSFQDEPSAETTSSKLISNQSYGVLLVTGSHTHQEDYARAFTADPRC